MDVCKEEFVLVASVLCGQEGKYGGGSGLWENGLFFCTYFCLSVWASDGKVSRSCEGVEEQSGKGTRMLWNTHPFAMNFRS